LEFKICVKNCVN